MLQSNQLGRKIDLLDCTFNMKDCKRSLQRCKNTKIKKAEATYKIEKLTCYAVNRNFHVAESNF